MLWIRRIGVAADGCHAEEERNKKECALLERLAKRAMADDDDSLASGEETDPGSDASGPIPMPARSRRSTFMRSKPIAGLPSKYTKGNGMSAAFSILEEESESKSRERTGGVSETAAAVPAAPRGSLQTIKGVRNFGDPQPGCCSGCAVL